MYYVKQNLFSYPLKTLVAFKGWLILRLQTCSHCKACSWTYALLSSNLSEIKWYILSESVPKGKGHKSMSKDLLQKRKYTLFSMYCLATRLHCFNIMNSHNNVVYSNTYFNKTLRWWRSSDGTSVLMASNQYGIT